MGRQSVAPALRDWDSYTQGKAVADSAPCRCGCFLGKLILGKQSGWRVRRGREREAALARSPQYHGAHGLGLSCRDHKKVQLLVVTRVHGREKPTSSVYMSTQSGAESKDRCGRTQTSVSCRNTLPQVSSIPLPQVLLGRRRRGLIKKTILLRLELPSSNVPT